MLIFQQAKKSSVDGNKMAATAKRGMWRPPSMFLQELFLVCLVFLQVTIEVVDGLEGHQPENGLRKESKPSWASPNWRNWWPHTSSSSHQTETHDRSYGGKTQDSNFLRPPADWDRRGSKAQTEYGEAERKECVHVCVCEIMHWSHRPLFEQWSPDGYSLMWNL